MRIRMATLAMTTTLMAGTAVAAIPPGTAAASSSPYKIAMISSLTGPGASQFSQAAAGFNARIALQNSEGGVHGHKIVPLVTVSYTHLTLPTNREV